jgi:uncharacterized protein YbjT (DUF2867 family)
MNIAVIGGTGTLGSLVVAELSRRGHAVRALSRSPPAVAAVEHRAIDLVPGAGLKAALEGVDVVVDAANSRGRTMREVLVGGTQRAARAAVHAGVRHYVLISIIGIDAVATGYYRAKLDQETALATVGGAELPHTVLRATQFHQLLDSVFTKVGRGGILPAGRLPLQPVDPAEVAVTVADLIERGPGEGRAEFGGPESRSLGELARQWMAARGARRLLIALPPAGRTARALRAGALTSDTARRGRRTFQEWLHAPGDPFSLAGAGDLAD